MTTPQQPTLAEIVAGLRKEIQRLNWQPDVGAREVEAVFDRIAMLRAAADRLEALAKLAEAVGRDYCYTYTEHVEADGTWLEWFKARDRLLK
jgi:hypothetical protein